MATKNLSTIDRATASIRVGVKLVGRFNDCALADVTKTTRLFSHLRQLIRCLPPTQYLSPEFEPNMAEWTTMWESGEYKAARFQMVLLVRKLKRYRDDWRNGGVATGMVLVPTRTYPSAARS